MRCSEHVKGGESDPQAEDSFSLNSLAEAINKTLIRKLLLDNDSFWTSNVHRHHFLQFEFNVVEWKTNDRDKYSAEKYCDQPGEKIMVIIFSEQRDVLFCFLEYSELREGD